HRPRRWRWAARSAPPRWQRPGGRAADIYGETFSSPSGREERACRRSRLTPFIAPGSSLVYPLGGLSVEGWGGGERSRPSVHGVLANAGDDVIGGGAPEGGTRSATRRKLERVRAATPLALVALGAVLGGCSGGHAPKAAPAAAKAAHA